MSSSNFLIEPRAVLVADASVVINLNATGRARDVITALPNRWVVTENARAELVSGMPAGYDDARQLQALIDGGIVDLVGVGGKGSGVYEELVDGSALRTLDDGEAATIACAFEVDGIAMIDERKAKSLCADRYPGLPVVSTIELLLSEAIALALGENGQIEAVVCALTGARMRVPPAHIGRVVALIGETRAASCSSLPRAARVPS